MNVVTRLDHETRTGVRWTAAIDEIEHARGRTFRVYTRRECPDLVEHDYYEAATLALARGVREQAVTQLRAGRRPDLQQIARDLKRRDRGLVTAVKDAVGAVLLGDTAPDELPEAP